MMPILRSEKNSAPDACASKSYGSLFAQEGRDELKRTLCEKVSRGLYALHQVDIADVHLVVNELVEEAERGPFKHLHVERNDDGSFRPLCTGCERPWCCIVFETIRLTADDIWKLGQRFAMAPDAFSRRYCERYADVKRPEFVYKLKRALPCEFLYKDRCMIYEDRPERCRNFPLQCDQNGENFVIYPWCNYFFNLLWHEATLRVMEHTLQNYHSTQTRIRYGGIVDTGVVASYVQVRE
ncbi:MAG: YkgJ family cysteine cluster protein [Halobacteriota archaeon]